MNLTLEVGGRRADGYHELRSVFLRIGLADRLSVAPAAAGEGDKLTLSGLRGAQVEGNLVVRAFELLRRTAEPLLPGLRADLDKQIPVGGGLGGGSSDAATALELAAAAWGIGLAPAQRAQMALALGSDVPFFASGAPAALVEGRGERLAPLPAVEGGAGVLLALSSKPLSTGWIFARYDEMAVDGAASPTDTLAAALTTGLTGAELSEWSGSLRDANHLWAAAASVAPELAERRAALEQSTGSSWLLSGSGPTLFALYPSLAEAVEVGRRLSSDRPAAIRDVMLCATNLDDPQQAWREEWPTEP